MTAPHQHASINQMHPESCSTTIPTWAWAVEPRMREKIKWSNRISPWSLAYATYCATAFAMTFRIKDANFTHFLSELQSDKTDVGMINYNGF